MLSFLKDHPFAVDAFFESSLVLTFAVPQEEARHLIPECLDLDTFNDKWAFIAVAMVQTRHLRPKGFPKMLGSNFFLIGYRVFVRYTDTAGKSMRGLYILGSATNKKRMELFGNIFTHYNYRTIDVEQTEIEGVTRVSSNLARFAIGFEDRDPENIALPEGSPFATWQEARKFAGPLPYTFTYQPSKRRVLIIEGVRQNWKPAPVRVLDHSFGFVDDLRLKEVRLANAFIVRNIPYSWKKGRVETFSG
jgi:Uncharacterized conserved protein (COG2071)